ncbi:anti-sigma factor RsbA family regulatory protein [Actinomadura fibrosa]|uniref:Anti-sigma factor RsbA family regulatory protein n=1 Tax=Actinomadura fibrosa TaxID=111802 RepID=A0ABW2XZK7_9ACTN|nr:anti-sigma factor RsbA family regulatory protein [Actinomadura fibrosa]
MEPPAGGGGAHQGLLYGSPEELLGAAVPFLRQGLAAGNAVVLACGNAGNALLAEALPGRERGDVVLVDRAQVYTRPAGAVAALRRFVRADLQPHARGVRLVGEVDFGADPASRREWMGFEAIMNVVLASVRLRCVCAYDTRVLPEPVLDAAARTHPEFLAPAGAVPSPGYTDPAAFVAGLPPARPDPLERTPPVYQPDPVTESGQIPALRTRLRSVLDGLAMPAPTRSNLLAAVSETLANGMLHGTLPVRLCLWADPSRLVCTVTDQGSGFDDRMLGYGPPGGDLHGGAGLWLARRCCDRVETFHGPDGFTVRLVLALPARPRPAEMEGTRARVENMQHRANAAAIRADRLGRKAGHLSRRAGRLA